VPVPAVGSITGPLDTGTDDGQGWNSQELIWREPSRSQDSGMVACRLNQRTHLHGATGYCAKSAQTWPEK
jgi:hypothetical protein